MAAPVAAVPGFTSASLYVGDLIPDVTEALLFEIFNAVGPVASVRVCREAATRRSLGYAYVNFHRAEDAERALDTLNFKNIKGKPCRIMWCNRDPSLRKSGLGNIFVNGLAKTIDNKQLYDTFSLFGNILSCKVSTNKNGESLGYGFVHFESDESAQAAIDKVNGKVIAGQQVTVQTFKNKKERGGLNKNVFTNVFVKNLPGDVTKEKVDELFSKHGQITSSVVNVDASNKTRAYAFINFNTSEEATAAVDGLNNYDFNGKKLFVGRAQKKEERERELREKFEQIKLDRLKKYQGVNLYIKNLSDEVDDERLNQEFVKFGSITSARVMRDQNGNSRGFGFVCFSTPEEATKAVTDMNGKMVGAKPLYVALAQRKEQRRAMLEQQHAARLGKMGPAPFPMYPPPQFAGMPPRGFAFPGQMPLRPGQFPPGRFPFPGQVPIRPGQPTFHLMPLNARAGPMPNGLNRRNQQNNQNRRPQQGQQQQQQGQQQQQQGIKYTDQARNRQQPAQQAAPAQQQTEPQQAAADEPLSLKALASAPVELQKQMIGERLFPLIVAQQPVLAGKITGMLLEMDNGELLHLLESPQALGEKITEAVSVLQDHGLVEGEGEADK